MLLVAISPTNLEKADTVIASASASTSLVAKRQMRPHPLVTPLHHPPCHHRPPRYHHYPLVTSGPVFPRDFLCITDVENKRICEFEKKRVTDGRTDQRTDHWTDLRTDGQTDGPTDGRTDPLTEMRGRI